MKRVDLKIKGNIDNILQFDSIFSDIRIIQLETNNECLISNIVKVLFYEDKIYLQDKFQKLLMFNANGRFLSSIGKKGRGPGEFLELRDFDIDNDGNIYILDFLKIHKYSGDGTFLTSFKYHFTKKEPMYFVPLQFVLTHNERFLIWGGSAGIKADFTGKLFAMYEMSKNGEITNGLLPLNYNTPSNFGRFKRYSDIVLIDPVFGSNIIYSFSSSGLEERYFIDFLGKTLDIPVPEGFSSLQNFKIKIDQNYYHSISGFIETDDWIYFHFLFKLHWYNVYFSKKLNKSFVSKPWPLFPLRFTPGNILGSNNNSFISFTDPGIIINQINDFQKVSSQNLPLSVKESTIKLEKLKATDNPVLFICSMRDY
ncbi:MAG: 6-bladed beta-propeller [Bacteroidales bacterium]|nr:6-bladed beta-propeller [Bacteroidales bacterium]